MGLRIKHRLARWRREEDGANAVEFVILLPIMLLLLVGVVNGGRIYWNYQSAVAGVRDAARYIARATNNDVCVAGGSTFSNAAASATATTIISNTMRYAPQNESGITNTSATGIFPLFVSLNSAAASRACLDLTANGLGIVPVVRVDAVVDLSLIHI